jgi:exodeoxyribonuclease V alpha subunit
MPVPDPKNISPQKPSPETQGANLKSLAGVIERLTFQNEENGYTVARFLPDHKDGKATPTNARGQDQLITLVGSMPGVVAGEALEVSGFWQNNSTHGWQFNVTTYRSVLPATEQGLRKYLGSGLIKGIREKTADKIVSHFGLETLEVLENRPERLLEVPKLGKHKAGLIARAWVEQKAIKEVMLFLQGHGISTSLAVRIYKEYGDKATVIVKNQPYRLAREVWGIGFKTADKIARSLGFAPDNPERIKAGTLFVLSEAGESGGHTYLPRPRLSEKVAELLEVTPQQVEEAIEGLVLEDGAKAETLAVDPAGELSFQPLVKVSFFGPGTHLAETPASYSTGTASANPAQDKLTGRSSRGSGDNRAAVGKARPLAAGEQAGATPTLSALPGEQVVYLPPFYHAESGVARNLLRLAGCPPHQDRLAELRNTDFVKMFDYLASKEKLALAERQKEGVVMGLVKPLGVLTGGPGTGKTTSMRALIRVLTLKKKSVVLAAPTGRAAKRLSEATGLEAKTLHRLLGVRPGGKAQYDQDTPIPADMVIVDETSMLDTLLMNTLLKAIGSGTHLLLVGDADQLPSVGAGNILADIINSQTVPVVRLEQIFRQSQGSAIVTNAHLINQGKLPVTGREVNDFFFFPEEDPEKAGELVVELVSRRIPARFGFTPAEIQVLAPMHRGRSGVGYLNERLQAVLNPQGETKPQKQYGGRLYRVGDKVLQLRNNYEKEVFNGDGGVITGMDLEDQSVKVRLEDGREVEYDFGELDELTLAYAVSIHKSQGSEYPVCVIPVMPGHYMLLERKLVYTAVTRARKLVVLVGSKKALAMAVRNGPSINEGQGTSRHRAGRYTGLAVRLAQLYQG